MNNLDSDIASMASLVQNLMHDMKTLPGAFDSVNTKALKLSIQINSMLTAFTGFIDAVQCVSDLANNLKGASRDIGASLTRFSMRQRSVEEYFRQFAKSLNDQFGGVNVNDRRHSDVKQTLNEIDRRYQKLTKKYKHTSRKAPANGQKRESEFSEHRDICKVLLRTQRSQFLWFNGLLVPVLNSQLTLFEEASNVRQVRDALDQARDISTDTVISNLLDDLSLHTSTTDSSVWQQRLGSPSRRSGRRTPSPTASAATWADTSISAGDGYDSYARPHTIAASAENGPKRGNITAFSYVPPTPSGKPPLPRAPSAPQGIASVGSNNISFNSQIYADPMRPLSLNGSENVEETGLVTPSNDSNREFLETLQEIKKLGAELNNYDAYTHPQQLQQQLIHGQVHLQQQHPMGVPNINGSMLSVGSIDSSASRMGTIRMRQPSQGPNGYRPPPPERRNSSIQAATTAAPSVADIRSALSSTNNSRTSSTQDLTMLNYPPPPPPLPSSFQQQYRY